MATLVDRLIAPALADGAEVRVHAHTWIPAPKHAPGTPCVAYTAESLRTSLATALADAAPRATVGDVVLDNPDAVPRPSAAVKHQQKATNNAVLGVASLERASGLALGETIDTGGEDAMVVVIRWDAVLYSAFEIAKLDAGLLYRANWCSASGMRAGGGEGRECYELQDFVCDATGVPDFYFAGNATSMRRVFAGLSERAWFASPPTVRNAGCCCMHGLLAGALGRAERQDGVALGRYLYHHIDYDFVRDGQVGKRFHDKERLAFVRSGGSLWLEGDADGLHEPPYRIDAMQRESVCSENLHICTWHDGARVEGDHPTGYHAFMSEKDEKKKRKKVGKASALRSRTRDFRG